MLNSALCKARIARSGVCSKKNKHGNQLCLRDESDSDSDSNSESDSPLNNAFSVPRKRAGLNQRSELSLSLKRIVLSYLKPYKGNLTVALLNINSLRSKLVEIQFMLEEQSVDILVLNETKLDVNDDQSLLEFDNYHCLRRDRKKQGRGLGGGIIVYIKESLLISNVEVHDLNEIISLTFRTNGQDLGLIACYRPPHPENEKSFFESITNIIDRLDEQSSEILLVSDLNYDMLDQITT